MCENIGLSRIPICSSNKIPDKYLENAKCETLHGGSHFECHVITCRESCLKKSRCNDLCKCIDTKYFCYVIK